ncbi:MAG: peptidase S16 [Acidobacteria bacterium]|nr:peptidase S16 [Acidobacteriota bacterium]
MSEFPAATETFELPIFPLGSVLFPSMPLALRVFEERYLAMLARVLQDEPSEFGVVLIERGQEVGGGEKRFDVGTIARIAQIESAEGFIAMLAHGTRRFRVIEWLPDDPYPRALVAELDRFDWDDTLDGTRDRVEQTVRRALAVGAEFGEVAYSATVELEDDPVDAAWQLAAIAPLGEMDQLHLLRSQTLPGLFNELEDLAAAAATSISDAALEGDVDDDDDPFGDRP